MSGWGLWRQAYTTDAHQLNPDSFAFLWDASYTWLRSSDNTEKRVEKLTVSEEGLGWTNDF